jgi:hypothetical protein
MRVFISWPGEPSRSIARSLRQALWRRAWIRESGAPYISCWPRLTLQAPCRDISKGACLDQGSY